MSRKQKVGVSKNVRKVSKPLPIIGQISAIAGARETLNEKGALLGGIDIALDLIPVVGRMKGLFELFGGELLNQRNIRQGFSAIRSALDEVEQLIAEDQNGLQQESSASLASASLKGESLRSFDTLAPEESIQTAVSSGDLPEESAEEPRHYPEQSARMAALRARAATRPVYEKRHGSASAALQALGVVDSGQA